MTLQIVPSEETDSIETTARPAFVQLSEAALQLEHKPAHDRVECADCGHQVNPRKAVRTADGLLCPGCAEDYDWS